MIAQDYLSGINPVYWQFWLGLLLVVVVLFARGGILGGLARGLYERIAGSAQVTAALRTDGPVEAMGRVQGEQRRHALLSGRRAPRADRAERRRQDDVHQPADRRVYPPTAGDVFLGDENITGLAQHERVKRGVTRTFQITTLFPGLTVLESVVLAICERKGLARIWWKTVASRAAEIDEAMELLKPAASRTRRRHARRDRCRTASSGWSRSRSRSLRDRRSCCSTSRRRASRRRERGAVRRDRALAARCDDRVHRARHGSRIPLRRADHRAGRRRGAGRRDARARSPPIRACGRSTWARHSMAELLALEGVTAGYGESIVLEDVSLAIDEGRQPRAARPQRRRQDHAAHHADGIHAAAWRGRSAGAGATSRRCRRMGARVPGSAGCRRSGSCSRRLRSKST